MKIRIYLLCAIILAVFLLPSCKGDGETTTSVAVSETASETGGNTDAPAEDYQYKDIVKSEHDNKYFNSQKMNEYYCPDVFNPDYIPCLVNIKTGEIEYACPIENCTHDDKNCFYADKDVNDVLYTGNYLFIYTTTPFKDKPQLFAYCFESNEMEEIVLAAGSTANFRTIRYLVGYSDNAVYAGFTFGSTSRLYEIDLNTGIGKSRSYDPYYITNFYYNEGEFIVSEGKNSGLNVIDTDGKIHNLILPEGAEGFKVRKKGFLYKTDKPARIYDTESGKFINFPDDMDITSPVKSGKDYYFQSRDAITTAVNASGENVDYIQYNNDVYIYSTDGKSEKYTVDTDYHFIIYAAYDGCVIGRIMYKLTDGVISTLDELEYDHIRIELASGETELLNLYGL